MLEYLKENEILKKCIPDKPRPRDNLFYFCRRGVTRFWINDARNGCASEGWMGVAEGAVTVCAYTSRNAFPAFYYAPGASKIAYSDFDSRYTKGR